MKTVGLICLVGMFFSCAVLVGIGVSVALDTVDKTPVVAPATRTPKGHLMMVLTDGKDFYVADGAGINVFDPNVVHRLMVAEPNAAPVEPNSVEPNTP